MLIPELSTPARASESSGAQNDERQVPVRDRRAERAVGGALRVDVDPLVVVGCVGERVDALLGHLEPVRRPELLAHQIA